MHDFWAMGGYGAYVWPAFAVTAAILGGLAWHAWALRRRLRRVLAMLGDNAIAEDE